LARGALSQVDRIQVDRIRRDDETAARADA
jgi:hypothetical protein